MTGKIIDFAAAKKNKSQPTAPAKTPPTPTELFLDIYEDIIGEWQAKAVMNSLNEFIHSRIPSYVRSDSVNYVGDLNVLSSIEQKLKMTVSVFYPGVTPSNPHGWLVGFHYDNNVYSAPSVMASELYSRALNILLFVSFDAQMKKMKSR
jgi:hypothetical protein